MMSALRKQCASTAANMETFVLPLQLMRLVGRGWFAGVGVSLTPVFLGVRFPDSRTRALRSVPLFPLAFSRIPQFATVQAPAGNWMNDDIVPSRTPE